MTNSKATTSTTATGAVLTTKVSELSEQQRAELEAQNDFDSWADAQAELFDAFDPFEFEGRF